MPAAEASAAAALEVDGCGAAGGRMRSRMYSISSSLPTARASKGRAGKGAGGVAAAAEALLGGTAVRGGHQAWSNTQHRRNGNIVLIRRGSIDIEVGGMLSNSLPIL